VQPGSADPLILTVPAEQPRLRPPRAVQDETPEPVAKALITMQVWHLALVGVIFVLVFWHFVLQLY
jgi:hypothetical protein